MAAENHADALRELGRRLARRRKEAGLEVDALGARAGVPARHIEHFEQGGGALGVGALTRLASALGVAPTAFLHTSAPEDKAPVEPGVLLKERSVSALLSPGDRAVLARGLQKAQAFSLLGEVLQSELLTERFLAKAASDRSAHRLGSACARQVRAMLPEPQGPLQGLGRLVERRFGILVLRHRFEQASVLGVSCRSGRARLLVINAQVEREPMYRFVLAQGLAHHLLDLSENAVTVDTASFEDAREGSPEQKRAKAFATMLLAPEESVRRELGSPRARGCGVAEARALVTRAGAVFGLGFSAMAWHLHHLRYFQSAETLAALLSAPSEDAPVLGFEEVTRFNGLERRALEAYAREAISSSRARELLGRPVEELLSTWRDTRWTRTSWPTSSGQVTQAPWDGSAGFPWS